MSQSTDESTDEARPLLLPSPPKVPTCDLAALGTTPSTQEPLGTVQISAIAQEMGKQDPHLCLLSFWGSCVPWLVGAAVLFNAGHPVLRTITLLPDLF
jgi:hypothetical protein